MAQKNSKKGKRRRVKPGKVAEYWNLTHTDNMARKAMRIEKDEGRPQADRYISLHSNGCKQCEMTLQARVLRLREAKPDRANPVEAPA